MTADFDPVRTLEVLHGHGVAFVLVGGLAAVAHGSTLTTVDVDITPERSDANFANLAPAGSVPSGPSRSLTSEPSPTC
ncbi:MAG: hypothetical protein ACR2MA_10960 [Egibacteraceae bacterium]